MTVWETEDEMATAAQASLPTPTDTPYRTPSRASRRSARRKSTSPVPSSSPPPVPHGEGGGNRNPKDVSTDETISILDPRRFTPTLHASLVSEILTLRRDQEEKNKTIENLEANLHNSRGEYESLAATLSVNAKETRSLKRQLALLEGGTSSALERLAKERDEAVDSVGELKRRLEATQKKIRSQEEDADRVHGLWDRDKDTWEDEKRKYERRVHVAEGRLKAVLEEVAAYQAAQRCQNLQQNGDSDLEDVPRENGVGHGSDTASVRSMSMTNSIRFSLLNGPNGYGGKLNGISLADELDLDEDDETDHDGRNSVMSTHRRTQSRESMLPRAHGRNRSIDSIRRPGSVRGRLLALDKLQCGIMEGDESAPEKDDQPEEPKAAINRNVYVEVGIQYTPPASPTSPVTKATPPLEDMAVSEEQLYIDQDADRVMEADQWQMNVYATPPFMPEPARNPTVSAASQTLEDPLSPPRTPKSPTSPTPPPTIPKAETKTSATQTDSTGVVLPCVPAPNLFITIPSISIHPPTSRPATPKTSLLPQHFKDAACQVSMQVSVPCRSTSVQTEEIRVDRRMNLLPKHLQPSSISSNPPSPSPSPEPQFSEKGRFSAVSISLPPRNPKRAKSQQSINAIPSSPPQPLPALPDAHDTYPRNSDEMSLANSKGSLKRPHRSSSILAAFEGVSSDEADDFADADLSDSDFRTALSAPKPKSSVRGLVRRTSIPPTSVPEGVEPLEEKTRPMRTVKQSNYDSNGLFTLPDAPILPASKPSGMSSGHQLDKPLSMVPTSKSSTMRRAALISNGIAAHHGRPRSPSLPETSREPPFPIPTRASSRKPPFSISAPSDGNRSPTRDNRGKHGRRGSGRAIYRTNSIRKVRSAAAIPANGYRYRRPGSRSPPPLSASTEAPESPQLPPMPMNDITSPELHGINRFPGAHRQQPSINTAHTSNTGGNSIGNSQGTSVVDAIAQTMVGEWMFKYVRRRKSLGVPDNVGIDGEAGSNGARHKRWVWLAPYERAVMWSGKQPTSGSALMGKSGRKLTIQSVLDVKDDNPSPRGMSPLFNRSILILTPARALKFTATTRERHYVWLTALSFLAHSSHAVPEIMAISAPPAVPEFEPPRPPRLRKNGAIRDSIRIAKGKAFANAIRSVPTSVHSSQQGGEPSIRTDVSTRGERASEHSQSAKEFTRFFPEAADPPIVPRFSDRTFPFGHGRKRSNTGSRVPPPLSFRGFSDRGLPVSSGISTSGGGSTTSYQHGNVNGYGGVNGGHNYAPSTAGISIGTNGSSDIYQSQHSSSAAGYGMSVSGRSSVRTSDASARPSAVVGNFFDAVGTVRMEAFISPISMNRFDEFPDEVHETGMMGFGRQHNREMPPRTRESRRRSRNRDSFYNGKVGGRDDWYGGSRTAGEEEYGMNFARERDDPFRGF